MLKFESPLLRLPLEGSGFSRRPSFNLAQSALRKMMIRGIATMSMAPREAPTPMPTLASVDNEDDELKEGELVEEDAAAERILGPPS